MTELRRALVDCLCCESGFEDRCELLTDAYDIGDVAAVEEPTPRVTADLDDRGVTLLGRIRRFDAGPLGITLSGPAYRDNPILYANEAFRDLTGYPLDELRGENPRLLQGAGTDPEAVATLREAVATWTEATVELRNYRRDGTSFRSRVTVVPVPDESGTIAHWLGIQAAVDG